MHDEGDLRFFKKCSVSYWIDISLNVYKQIKMDITVKVIHNNSDICWHSIFSNNIKNKLEKSSHGVVTVGCLKFQYIR